MTTTTALNTTPSTSTPTSGTAKDRTTFGNNFDQFLKLLVTQMKNQDPMEPMDASEFTNQLVQFAGIEQNIKSNTLLEKIAGNQTVSQLRDAGFYVGKAVSVKTDKLVRGDTTTPSTFTYTNDKKYSTSRVTILDRAKNVVKVFDRLSGEAGVQTVTWDGKNTQGVAVPIGQYTIKADGVVKTGNGPDDEKVTQLVSATIGFVRSAMVENGKIMLDVDGAPITEDKIVSILSN